MSRRRAISPISLKLGISMYFWSLNTNLEEFLSAIFWSTSWKNR